MPYILLLFIINAGDEVRRQIKRDLYFRDRGEVSIDKLKSCCLKDI